MFYSNVAPKLKKLTLDEWFCHRCNLEVAKYMRQCPSCGLRREH